MTQYLTCQPKDIPASEPPCADVGGAHYGVVVIEDGLGQIDAQQFADLTAYALGIVVFAYFIGVCVGSIIKLIDGA